MKVTDSRFMFFDVLAMICFVVLVAVLWLVTGKALALWTIGVPFANHVVGACVCACADDEDGSMLRWADEAPSMVLQALITQAWPLILWVRITKQAET